jgi:hypothetical protein
MMPGSARAYDWVGAMTISISVIAGYAEELTPRHNASFGAG